MPTPAWMAVIRVSGSILDTTDSTGVWCTPDTWPDGGSRAFDSNRWLWSRDGKERHHLGRGTNRHHPRAGDAAAGTQTGLSDAQIQRVGRAIRRAAALHHLRLHRLAGKSAPPRNPATPASRHAPHGCRALGPRYQHGRRRTATGDRIGQYCAPGHDVTATAQSEGRNIPPCPPIPR